MQKQLCRRKQFWDEEVKEDLSDMESPTKGMRRMRWKIGWGWLNWQCALSMYKTGKVYFKIGRLHHKSPKLIGKTFFHLKAMAVVSHICQKRLRNILTTSREIFDYFQRNLLEKSFTTSRAPPAPLTPLQVWLVVGLHLWKIWLHKKERNKKVYIVILRPFQQFK